MVTVTRLIARIVSIALAIVMVGTLIFALVSRADAASRGGGGGRGGSSQRSGGSGHGGWHGGHGGHGHGHFHGRGCCWGGFGFYAFPYYPYYPYYPYPAYSYPPPVYTYTSPVVQPSTSAPSVGGYSTLETTPIQREVVYPNGRYLLQGDGVTQPWQWIWVPNPPAAPPQN